MKLQYKKHRVKLSETFSVSRESYNYQDAIIVRLGDGAVWGYGEATAFAVYGAALDKMESLLMALSEQVDAYTFVDPPTMWHDFQRLLTEEPFLQAAIDIAAYDYWGKTHNAQVKELLGLSACTIPSNYTLGIDSAENTLKRIERLPNWEVFKLKVGGEHDLQVVSELRARTTKILRVDANCGWDTNEAIAKSIRLFDLGVEYIEQPLSPKNVEGAKLLYRESPLPIIADESCSTEADLERCRGMFHGVNVKLQKCGGITPALRMIDAARKYDLKLMIGCMPETSVGVSAIAQLASLLDYVDVDSIMYLAEDIAEGLELDSKGYIRYSKLPGCGVKVADEFSRTGWSGSVS